jgi:hypothetical protein
MECDGIAADLRRNPARRPEQRSEGMSESPRRSGTHPGHLLAASLRFYLVLLHRRKPRLMP